MAVAYNMPRTRAPKYDCKVFTTDISVTDSLIQGVCESATVGEQAELFIYWDGGSYTILAPGTWTKIKLTPILPEADNAPDQ